MIQIRFSTRLPYIQIRGFDRIVTPRFTMDVDELRSWSMDVRNILEDNALRDFVAESEAIAEAQVADALRAMEGSHAVDRELPVSPPSG